MRTLAERMLAEVDLSRAELSVLLTNDAQIHELNRTHRQKDRPTDVLAFPLDDEFALGDEAPLSHKPTNHAGAQVPRLLGDVVISLDTAARQASSRRRELLAEVRFLLAHGLAHLLGYDHATAQEKKAMDAMTRRLVRAAMRDLPAASAKTISATQAASAKHTKKATKATKRTKAAPKRARKAPTRGRRSSTSTRK